MKITSIFLGTLCLIFFNIQAQEAPTIQIGKTITIKSQFLGLPVVEPHISAHPANNDHLLVAAMVVTDINKPYQSCRLSSFVSKDGGVSWAETAHDYWGYDPWTAILPNGKTTMSWLGTPKSFKHQFPIQFFSSNDGGTTWLQEPQTFASDHGHDGTKITALNNHFYFTTVRFNGNMSADVVLYHRLNDDPFEEVSQIDAQGLRLNFCEPAILSDGTVLVPASHFLRKIWVHAFDPQTKTLSEKQMISLNPGGGKGYMRLVADVSAISPFKDRVYFVRATGSRNEYGGIWVNYSSDKGKTWSTDKRVDIFENNFPSKAIVASAAVNKNGILGISWVDRQHDPSQKKNDMYFTISLDGGVSFLSPMRITDISTNPKTNENGDVANKFSGGGHYLDITGRQDGSFQLIWSDSRSGVFELQTCNVVITAN